MKTHILRALSEKSFVYLWVGEIFTVLSGNIFNFFLILFVFKQTHSNVAVSAVVLSFTVPAILFGSIAGAYVDRWNKKKVLVITNVIRALLLLILSLSVSNLFILYIISFVFAIFTQFFIPAEIPIIPLVVSERHLFSANALFAMAIFGSILGAYILSGPLLIFFSPLQILLFLSALLFIGTGFIWLIGQKGSMVRNSLKEVRTQNIGNEIKHTLALIFHSKAITHSLFLLALSQILILVLATIAPGYASQILGIHVEDFSLRFVTPAALGMVIGAVILVNFFHSHPKERVINAGIFLSGIAMLLLPYGSKVAARGFIHTLNAFLPGFLDITIFHIMFVLAFLLGAANSFVFVPANTILQEETTDAFRGKIYGVLNTVVGVLSLLPIILVGGFSDIFGVGNVITGIGICLLLLGVSRLFTV